MEATYRQGESWMQPIRLVRNHVPLSVGPAAQAPTLIHSLEVLLHSGGRPAAHYRWPTDPARPERLPIAFDPTQANLITLSVSREQSRRFEPGYLAAYVLAVLIDPGFAAGRAIELEIPLGVVLRGETAHL
jgi:hypothetical protein